MPDRELLHEWSVKSSTRFAFKHGRQDGIDELRFTADGDSLLAVTRSRTIHKWQLTPEGPKLVLSATVPNADLYTAVALPPHGDQALVGIKDELFQWKMATGQSPTKISREESSAVYRIDISRSGKLAAYSSDDRVVVLSTADLQPVSSHVVDGNHCWWLRISPDERFVAVALDDRLRILDVEDGAVVMDLQDPAIGSHHQGVKGAVTGMGFSPDGALLATGGLDKMLRVWDLAGGDLASAVFIGGTDNVFPAFDRDGSFLATTADQKTTLFEVNGLEVFRPFALHRQAISSFDCTNNRVACLIGPVQRDARALDNDVSLWDLNGTTPSAWFSAPRLWTADKHSGISFSADGSALAYCYDAAEVVMLRKAAATQSLELQLPPGAASDRARQFDARQLVDLLPEVRAALARDPDAANGTALKLTAEGVPEFMLRAKGLSSEKKKVQVLVRLRVQLRRPVGSAFRYGVWKPRRADHRMPARAVADERYHWYSLEAFTFNERVHVFVEIDRAAEAVWFDKMIVAPYDDVPTFIETVAFDRKGTRLWSIADENKIVGRPLNKTSNAVNWNNSASKILYGRDGMTALSADDRWLAAGSTDGSVRLFDVASGEPEKTDRVSETDVRCVCLTRKGSRWAAGTADGRVFVLGSDQAGTPRQFDAHAGPVNTLAWSPNGSLLMTAGDDGTIRFWITADREYRSVLTLTASSKPVRQMSLGGNGRFLVIHCKGERGLRRLDLAALRTKLARVSLDW